MWLLLLLNGYRPVDVALLLPSQGHDGHRRNVAHVFSFYAIIAIEHGFSMHTSMNVK